MNEETIAVYFGCWDQAGHYLWDIDKTKLRDIDVKRLSVPTVRDLDGPRLFLPNTEKKGTGCITYLPGLNRTILAWWGSPWDSRPAGHAAFITNGEMNGSGLMWQRFIRYFPELSDQIERPSTAPRRER